MVGIKIQTLELEKDGESSSFPAPCKDFIVIFLALLGLISAKSGRSPIIGRAAGSFSILVQVDFAASRKIRFSV